MLFVLAAKIRLFFVSAKFYVAKMLKSRLFFVPLPSILSKKQREDYMIMDDQYFSFDALSKIYSVKDILCC